MFSNDQCDINNVLSSVIKLDKNIFYVDGFMVYENKDGSRCVFDFQNPGRIYVSKAAKKAVAELPLFNWQEALLGMEKGTGVKCTSEALITFIETHPMDVYELDGVYHRRKVRDSKNIKTLPSITVETIPLYGKLNNYFLYFDRSSFIDVITIL